MFKAHNFTKKEGIDYLIKTGSNKDHAKQLFDKNNNYIHRVYNGQNISKKTMGNIMRQLGR